MDESKMINAFDFEEYESKQNAEANRLRMQANKDRTMYEDKWTEYYGRQTRETRFVDKKKKKKHNKVKLDFL